MVSMSNVRSTAVGALIGAALLLPWQVTAESSLATGARTASVGATAHLDFKIVIPPVLALSIESTGVAAGAAPRVSIFSNTRHVLLTASTLVAADERSTPGRTGPSETLEPHPAGLAANPIVDGARRTVLFSAARHAVIAAETACRLGGPRPVATPGRPLGTAILDLHPVVCTVAMP